MSTSKTVLNSHKLALLIIFLISFFLRSISYHFNRYPHGDIFQEIFVAQQLLDTGLFAVPFYGPVVTQASHLTDKFIISDKPPLWIVMISMLSRLTKQDTYSAAKILTLLIFLPSFILFYLSANKILKSSLSLIATAIYSLSFLSIDFSANGSRYIFQTLIILCLAYMFLHPPKKTTTFSFLSGILIGLGFLVNYPLSLLLLAVMAVQAMSHTLSRLNLLILFSSFAITISPWILFNLQHYHTPILATNLARFSPGTQVTWTNNQFVLDITLGTQARFGFFLSIPHSLFSSTIYFSRKMINYLPLLFLFIIRLLKPKHLRRRQIYSLLVLTFIHFLAFGMWQMFKFRYSVSLFPLVILLSLLSVKTLSSVAQNIILYSSLISTIVISTLIFFINPYHTFYYDGVITTDAFGKAGEENYMNSVSEYLEFSQRIPSEAYVATTLDRAYFLDTQILLINPLPFVEDSPEILAKHPITHLWYSEPLDPELIRKFPNLTLVSSNCHNYLYHF